MRRLRNNNQVNIWPGFVDALATLLITLLFLLMVFVLAQFFLGNALFTRNQEVASLGNELQALSEALSISQQKNKSLEQQAENLADRLIAEQQTSENLRDELQRTIAKSEAEIAALKKEYEAEINVAKEKLKLTLKEIALLEHDREVLEAMKKELNKELSQKTDTLQKERKISEEAKLHAALLNKKVDKLNTEISKLLTALEASEELAEKQKVQIKALGNRLNKALANKTAELARYRSEFFGKLREVLGKNANVKIEGDRFVFQSEILFESGKAAIGEAGKKELHKLAATLLDISKKIPEDIDWILRVDGHTDRLPINNEEFSSNWELSTARAVSVVEHLISEGIPPKRLAATGFGEHRPLKNATSLRENRRIEFKLTN